MLASISPLGERARGNRWGVTVAAFAVGSIGAAAALGALLGVVGRVVHPQWLVLAGAAIAAGVVEFAGLRIPGWRRQVNEDWLGRYRGWVYGVGFGAQLGVGVATIVTTATVYAWVLAAAVSGAGGWLVGAAFGLGRALPLLVVARANDPGTLRRTMRRLADLSTPSKLATGSAAVTLGLVAAWQR